MSEINREGDYSNEVPIHPMWGDVAKYQHKYQYKLAGTGFQVVRCGPHVA